MKYNRNQVNSPDEVEGLIHQLKQDLGLTHSSFATGNRTTRNLQNSHRKTSSHSFMNQIDLDSPDNKFFDLNQSYDAVNTNSRHGYATQYQSRVSMPIHTDLQLDDDDNSLSHNQQLVQLFTIAETLAKDYKKSNMKLQKQRYKCEQQQATINENETEIQTLRHKREEDEQIMLQLESDYGNLKLDYQQLLDEVQRLNRENELLRGSLTHNSQQKDDLQLDLKLQTQQLRDTITNLDKKIEDSKKIIKEIDADRDQLYKRVQQLEKENINLSGNLQDSIEEMGIMRSDLRIMKKKEEDYIRRQQDFASQIEYLERQLDEYHDLRNRKETPTQISTSNTPNNLQFQLNQMGKDNQLFIDLNEDEQSQEEEQKVQVEEKQATPKLQKSFQSLVPKIVLKLDDNELEYDKSNTPLPNSARQESSNQKDKTLAHEINVEAFDDAFSNDDANNQFIFNEHGELSPRYTPNKAGNFQNVFNQKSLRKDLNNSTICGYSRTALVARVRPSSRITAENQMDSHTVSPIQQNCSIIMNNNNPNHSYFDQSVILNENELQLEFKQYLGRVYADIAFEKYKQILKNEKKISIKDIRQKRNQSRQMNSVEKRYHTQSACQVRQEEELLSDGFSFSEYLQKQSNTNSTPLRKNNQPTIKVTPQPSPIQEETNQEGSSNCSIF
ncbi:UNKNOWN [Stylonychia lemnae]|uniref:Uncharacterized protein n=1 Tax=Stylonychia lemnae TaxID=5949 RepID=A0A078A926_STYLE|nr:UNKNOWN [Stylonychia lemnae]|eukprot:CDW78775.1 UNKNOWN [Stylonychia lemnae]